MSFGNLFNNVVKTSEHTVHARMIGEWGTGNNFEDSTNFKIPVLEFTETVDKMRLQKDTSTPNWYKSRVIHWAR